MHTAFWKCHLLEPCGNYIYLFAADLRGVKVRESFITADHHFGHDKILEYEKKRGQLFSCIEEHDEELIKRWNEVVKPRDTVIHLGDIAFKKKGFANLWRLNGETKKLIIGNHDTLDSQEYLQIFNKLFGSLHFRGTAILTHIPVHPQQLNNHYAFNLHGHLHGRGGLDDKRYIDVGVDAWDYRPVAWSEIKELIAERL